jgi:predicted RNA binding protein YcfA (HicA-like mRNA interferase family)
MTKLPSLTGKKVVSILKKAGLNVEIKKEVMHSLDIQMVDVL